MSWGSAGRRGPDSLNWNPSGRSVTAKGYVAVRVGPSHPMQRDGWVQEHRLVMAERIGRLLDPGEVVHHVDGDPGNNDHENLWLWPDAASHTVWHAMLRNGRELRRSMPAVRLPARRRRGGLRDGIPANPSPHLGDSVVPGAASAQSASGEVEP